MSAQGETTWENHENSAIRTLILLDQVSTYKTTFNLITFLESLFLDGDTIGTRDPLYRFLDGTDS